MPMCPHPHWCWYMGQNINSIHPMFWVLGCSNYSLLWIHMIGWGSIQCHIQSAWFISLHQMSVTHYWCNTSSCCTSELTDTWFTHAPEMEFFFLSNCLLDTKSGGRSCVEHYYELLSCYYNLAACFHPLVLGGLQTLNSTLLEERLKVPTGFTLSTLKATELKSKHKPDVFIDWKGLSS
jgi:hypothetical protein